MRFQVDLDMFRGPLDLLLYLVRRHELDIVDIPIALVTEQYLEYLTILEKMDINAVGEFLELASILIEIKSRMVLPRMEEVHDTLEDPRHELVQRLLEYKKFKDAAGILEERSREWQQHFPRMADDLVHRPVNLAEQPIREVELWDLVSALGRVIRANELVKPASIVYDDTPIRVYIQDIHGRLVQNRRVAFTELFEPGVHKSAMIGIFLAVLELVRHHRVLAEQVNLHGEIWLLPREGFSESMELSDSTDYEHPSSDNEDLSVAS